MEQMEKWEDDSHTPSEQSEESGAIVEEKVLLECSRAVNKVI